MGYLNEVERADGARRRVGVSDRRSRASSHGKGMAA